jgi:hypothetical protein
MKTTTTITIIIITRAAAITCSPSRSHQRCTAAKDGKFEGGLLEQRYAVEFVD